MIDDTLCSTLRQLTAELGRPECLAWLDHAGEMDWCLCVVDLPATLRRAGFNWERQADPEVFVIKR